MKPTSASPALACALALLGCHDNATPNVRPARASSAMDLASIPPTPVAGLLAGSQFTTRSVWYRTVYRAGRERVDLVFTEGRRGRLCSAPVPERSRQVFLRFPGVTRLGVGVQSVDPPAATPLTVHYEVPDGDDEWRGHGGGSAVVAIDRVDGRTLIGRAHVCFSDARRGCVLGSFEAAECADELDVDGPHGAGMRRAVDGGASR